MFKKILCFSLCAIMLCGCFLIGASADEPMQYRPYTVSGSDSVNDTYPSNSGSLSFTFPKGTFKPMFSISSYAEDETPQYYEWTIPTTELINYDVTVSVTVSYDLEYAAAQTIDFSYGSVNKRFINYFDGYFEFNGEMVNTSSPWSAVMSIDGEFSDSQAAANYKQLIDLFFGNDVAVITEAPYEEQGILGTIKLMFTNFGIAIGGLAEGIKESTTNLLWKDPSAANRQLSDVAIFIFTIAGLAIGMTVFFLVFRLIRFGRQR